MLNKKQLGQKIRELREAGNLSQEEMAKKIGLSRAAISMTESGKRDLEALELAKIAQVFNIPADFLLRNESAATPKRKKQAPNGAVRFNKEKLKSIILYILNKCGGKPNIGETVLYKLLYFADFDNYELRGESISGMRYVKLQYGPVPHAAEYGSAIKDMLADGKLKIISQTYHGMPQKRYIALSDYDMDGFVSSEIKIIDAVISRLSDMNAVQIEDYAHDDIPWKAAREKQVIDYDLAFLRSPKFSRQDYGFLMQNAAGEDYLKNNPISREEYDYYDNLTA